MEKIRTDILVWPLDKYAQAGKYTAIFVDKSEIDELPDLIICEADTMTEVHNFVEEHKHKLDNVYGYNYIAIYDKSGELIRTIERNDAI